jgi:hypothetical protein
VTVDDTKVNYYNGWDIDQLLVSDTIAVGAGSTAIYTISGVITLPEYEVQFQPTGSTFWYQEGQSSSDGTLANLFTFWSYINGASIFINVPSAGTARYFVWADKFNY